MEILKLVKLVIVAVVIIVALVKFISKIRKRKNPFYDLIIPPDHVDKLVHISDRSEVDNLFENENQAEYDRYDNIVYKLSEMLLDPLPALINERNEIAYYQKLNKAQRVFSLVMQFEGQVDNGGVYQFLWNQPLSIFVMPEVLEEIKMERLAKDFRAVLKELEAHSSEYGKDRAYWNDASVSQEDKWKRFQEGRRYIPTGTIIEDYFYGEECRKKWHASISKYVKDNLNKFIA